MMNGHTAPQITIPTLDLKDTLYSIISANSYLHNLTITANLFNCGLDSLQIPVLVDEINAFLIKSESGMDLINAKTMLKNPSIDKLASALESSLNAL
jgi:aryl carrier-like protein